MIPPPTAPSHTDQTGQDGWNTDGQGTDSASGDSQGAREMDIAELAAHLRLSTTRLARRLRQESDAGLSLTGLSALAVVSARGPLTLGALAEIEGVAPPTITKVIKRLQGSGLVKRTTDKTDGRVRNVSCTELGQELLESNRARKNAWLASKLAEVDPAGRKALLDVLDVLDSLAAGGGR